MPSTTASIISPSSSPLPDELLSSLLEDSSEEELSSDEDAIFYFTNGVEDKPYVPAEYLAEEAKKYISKENIFIKNMEDAINDVIQNYKDRTVFIVGSFYVYKKVIETLQNN